MPPLPQNVCWICKKPVSPERDTLDEFGFYVHEECLNRKTKTGSDVKVAKKA
jgi:hypothetical protein